MKIKSGQPLVEMGDTERKALQKLLTQTNKAYDLNAGLSRLFSRSDFTTEEGWTFKEHKTATIAASVLRTHLTEIRTALRAAEGIVGSMLDDLTTARKTKGNP